MTGSKLTSIIILAFNQLEYTKLCIESIYRYTIPPFELVLVDNGSTDGTAGYFDSIAGAKVVKNKTNLGFAKGCNQGIEKAEGDYILLLNNDTIVTEHWLDNMLECIESDPSIGVVGPRSNYVNGPQFIAVDYESINDMHRFAREFNSQGPDKWFDVEVIIGFCMLMKREVVDKIGMFDERFKIGNFEDNDFCTRAKMAWYRLVCAGNTFIHHFGNKTFNGNQMPYEEIMLENMKVFAEKWGLNKPGGSPVDKKPEKCGTIGNDVKDLSKDLSQGINEALYTKAKLEADKFESERGELSILFHQGLIYYIDKRYEKALAAFQGLVQKIPSSIHARYALALAFLMLGKIDGAKTSLSLALEQQPDNTDLLLAYADCLVLLGKLDDAGRYYKRILEVKASCTSAKMGLAIIEKIKEQPELLKFVNNLEALVNLKSKLAKEQGEHFSVTYLTVNHSIAGGPKIYFEHINRLVERGHDVCAVSHWLKPEWFELYTEVINVPLSKPVHEYVPPESDVVVATFWTQMHDLLKVKDTARVYLAQGDRYLFEKDEEKRTDGYQMEIQKLADANYNLPTNIFVISEGLGGLIHKYYERESTLIPNAIDLSLFKPRRRRKKQKPKLLMIGPDDLAFKGLHYVNEAFQMVKNEHDVEVVWVSPKPRTSLQTKCDTFIQAPTQEELAKIYADCDIFVYASIYDAFPLPPLEAMACGTPVVVTVSEGAKSYIKDGVNCLTVPIRDADAIYRSINQLLDNDLLRERVTKGGLDTASKHNWERAIDILEENLWNLALSPKVPFTAVLPEEIMEKKDIEDISGNTKTSDYYHFQRPDIIELVPASAKRILDVGCAAGVVGKILKERGAIEVVGIEVVEEAAREANQHLDKVIIGNIEEIDLDYPEGYFDCVILADVLEHLYNPWQALAKLRRYLAPGGKLVCSIPNIGHVSILRDLLSGSWKYEEAGILDITHLRFFTLEGAFTLLMSAGFEVDNVTSKIICGPDEAAFLAKLRASGLMAGKPLEHATAYQFLLTAIPSRSRADVDASADGLDLATTVADKLAGVVAAESQGGDDMKPSKRPTLSLAMIVKDEADNLGRCLESVQGVADEIVIVDTGSTDNTVEIAQRFGAKVVHHKWENDFSAARNVSLGHSTGDWVMFLDADEELVGEDSAELKKLLEDTNNEGFYFNLLSFVGENEDDGAVVNIAFRLWRNKPEYRFSGAIHEQIVAKIQSHNPSIGFSGVRINHYGYLNKVTEEKSKVQRNLNILLKEVEKSPDDPFVRFNLGVEYLRLKDYEKAIEQYKKAFANLSGLDAAYASMLVRNIALCLRELGRYQEALKVLKDAKEAYADYTDLFYLEGLIYLDKKDFMTAIKCFNTCLEMGPAGKVHISQTGVGGHMAAYALARAYRALGNEQAAVITYKKALESNPRDCLSATELGLMLVRREKPDELKRFIESLVDMSSGEVLLSLAHVFSKGGYYETSLGYLDRLANNCANPSRTALLRGECLLNLKRYQEAISEFNSIPKTSQYYQYSSADKTLCYVLMGDYKSATNAVDSIKDSQEYRLVHDLYKAFVDILKGNTVSVSLKSSQREDAYRIIADLLGKILELEEFEVFEKAIDILKQVGLSSGESNLLLGKVYYDAGYNEMSVEALIRAYENNCADGEAFFILGRTAFDNAYYEEAKTFLTEALNRGIEEITLYISLTRSLIKLGKIKEAVGILDAGAKKYPDSPLIAEIKRSISALV